MRVNLWNETYSECKLVDLKGKPLSVEPMFDICLDIFASKCKKVLDFGCGTGDIIFQCYEFGNTGYGLGVDVSETGINYATKMAKINNYDNLEFKVRKYFCSGILMRMALLMALFCLTFLM